MTRDKAGAQRLPRTARRPAGLGARLAWYLLRGGFLAEGSLAEGSTVTDWAATDWRERR